MFFSAEIGACGIPPTNTRSSLIFHQKWRFDQRQFGKQQGFLPPNEGIKLYRNGVEQQGKATTDKLADGLTPQGREKSSSRITEHRTFRSMTSPAIHFQHLQVVWGCSQLAMFAETGWYFEPGKITPEKWCSSSESLSWCKSLQFH
jgi:hypothetical protein